MFAYPLSRRIPSKYWDNTSLKIVKFIIVLLLHTVLVIMTDIKKTIKFHGLEVSNVIVRYTQREVNKPDAIKIQEFDATKDPQICETVNIQVVSEFVTITFYKNESDNIIIRRELIPTFIVEHIWVSDLQQ